MRCLVYFVVAVAIGSLAFAPASVNSQESTGDAVGPVLTLPLNSPEVDLEEVLRLRDALGVGAITQDEAFDPFQIAANATRTLQVDPLEDQRAVFRANIRRLINDDVNVLGLDLPDFSLGGASQVSWEAAQGIASEPAHPNSKVDVLRSVATQFDEAANALERQDLFGEADKIRSMATQMRTTARELKIVQSAETSPVATDAQSKPAVERSAVRPCRQAFRAGGSNRR